MNLRNKKTGEIGYLLVGKGSDHYIVTNDEWESCGNYGSLTELTEEWEDAPEEERKEYWCVDWTGGVNKIIPLDSSHDKYEQSKKEIGNYFDTEEEAEKAVEKLRALKRLKDKGFKFTGWGLLEYAGCDNFDYSPQIGFSIPTLDKDEPYEYPEEIERDLDLLFGGEE